MARNYAEDERVLGAFLNNYNTADIIRASGLSKTTIYKLKKDPIFKQKLAERKTEVLQGAVDAMRSCLVKDVQILQDIIENEDNSPQVKINAIQVLFNQLRDLTTTVDIVTRLDELQRTVGNGNMIV